MSRGSKNRVYLLADGVYWSCPRMARIPARDESDSYVYHLLSLGCKTLMSRPDGVKTYRPGDEIPLRPEEIVGPTERGRLNNERDMVCEECGKESKDLALSHDMTGRLVCRLCWTLEHAAINHWGPFSRICYRYRERMVAKKKKAGIIPLRKPRTTGRFKTREELEEKVMILWETTDISKYAIAREVGVSFYSVEKILDTYARKNRKGRRRKFPIPGE